MAEGAHLQKYPKKNALATDRSDDGGNPMNLVEMQDGKTRAKKRGGNIEVIDDGIENLDGNGQPMNLVEMQDGKVQRKGNDAVVVNGGDFVQEQPVVGTNMQYEANMVGDVDGQGKKKKKKKKKVKKADEYGNEDGDDDAKEGLLVSYKDQ